MIKIILCLSLLIPNISFSQDEYDNVSLEDLEETENIDDTKNSEEQDEENSERPSDEKSINEPKSKKQNSDDNIEVIDLKDINFEEKESEWKSRTEADEDNEQISIIDEIIENTNDYSYAGFKRPDPFREPTIDDLKKAYMIQEVRFKDIPDALIDENGKEIPMVSPLQYHELHTLKIKGIWVNSKGEHRAMILTPDNEGVIIKKDDPISAGKVLDIDQEKVLVRQYKVLFDGSRTYEDLGMYLNPPKEKLGGVIVFEAGKEAQFIKNSEPVTALFDSKRPSVISDDNGGDTRNDSNPPPPQNDEEKDRDTKVNSD